MKQEYTQSAEELLRQFDTSGQGLSLSLIHI